MTSAEDTFNFLIVVSVILGCSIQMHNKIKRDRNIVWAKEAAFSVLFEALNRVLKPAEEPKMQMEMHENCAKGKSFCRARHGFLQHVVYPSR